jgi:hypothetical protein
MTLGSGDGPASMMSLGLHVGADWSAHCHTYPRERPILDLRIGKMTLSLSAKGGAISKEHVDFGYALLAELNEYVIECERLLFDVHDGDGPAELAA